ncbi:MAG: cob(I)yrinic acid a,c-diamide adenosyltransferase [Pirellulaceae bacterium]|nr:cob(I)yrinic acid a,c-diamide adenosyltransferase [Pirellulaceae bacterium]
MKIYTKTGDAGETGLWGATRVSKADARIECLGSVDELNASLGYLRTQTTSLDAEQLAAELGLLLPIQKRLFELGAAVADVRRQVAPLDLAAATEALEKSIDRQTDWLPPLTSFILPAGTSQSTLAHLSRAVCRRAERVLVKLLEEQASDADPHAIKNLKNAQIYLNRLSDWLFVLARALNNAQHWPDEPWPG